MVRALNSKVFQCSDRNLKQAFICMSDEGIVMCKTENSWGKWSDLAIVRKIDEKPIKFKNFSR